MHSERKSRSLKILLLSNKVPYPADDGSSIAIAAMIDALLKNDVEVTLLSLNTAKHFKKDEETKKRLPEDLEFHSVFADTNITPSGAALNLISGKPYHVSRFKQKAFAKKLKELLTAGDYDIVQLEGLTMAVYLDLIRKNSKAKVVLRAHNLENQIWERHIENEPNILKRSYLGLQVARLSDFEVQALYDVDAVVSITEEDLKGIRKIIHSKEGISIPCGVDIKSYEPCRNTATTADLAYLASFDWLPNRQGAWWFLEEVWPLVQQTDPDVTFKIGGRHMPMNMRALDMPGLEVVPDVPDMRRFICSSRLVVVPLLAGSGMRIKILENMALGACQITTSIGAEGIMVEDGEDIVLADDPQQMADAILSLLKDPERVERIGKAARKKVVQHYSNTSLGERLLDFYESEVC